MTFAQFLPISPNQLSLKSGFGLMVLSLMLIGCQPPADRADDGTNGSQSNKDTALSPVKISEDSVTITQDHLLNIKFKRYQPSLGLDGTTFAAQSMTLTSPVAVSVESILVNAGQEVKQGDSLLTLKVIAPDQVKITHQDPQSHHDDPNADQINSDAKIAPKSSAKKSTTSAHSASQTAVPVEVSPSDSGAADNSIASRPITPPVTQAATQQNGAAEASYQVGQTLSISAPFAGRIDQIYPQLHHQMAANLPLIKISNPQKLKFIGTLPIEAQPQLSIGQTVNFSVDGSHDTFTGQLSQMTPSHNPSQLLAHVDIIITEDNKDKLSSGMVVEGRIDYGQIEVGTIVPKAGIHDADLSALSKPPYQAKVPIKANVWIIGQDQRLTRQQVDVIEYDPKTEQYLVAGISNDSLICLAPLPADSAGKKVIVS